MVSTFKSSQLFSDVFYTLSIFTADRPEYIIYIVYV